MRFRLVFCLFIALVFGFLFLAATDVRSQTPDSYSKVAASEKKSTEQPGKISSYTLSPEKYKEAVAYSRAKNILFFISSGYGFLILILILFLRITPRFRNWAQAASRYSFVQALIFVPLFSLCVAVLNLPVDIYTQHLELKYEQSVQTWGSWILDWVKSQCIGLIIMTVLIWILYLIIRKFPKRWWFYFWMAFLPIMAFLLFVEPIWIEPLFYKFQPLTSVHPELVAKMEEIVHRAGVTIPPERFFLMKASEKSRMDEGNVSGFGPTLRVVIWDTELQYHSTFETLFVFGHEMGHYVLRHVYKTAVFLSLLMLFALWLCYYSAEKIISRSEKRWEIQSLADWASYPLLALLISLFFFFATPAISSFNRMLEHQADTYGLEVIHGIVPDANLVAAKAFETYGKINLRDPNPNPIIEFWLYDHPSVSERINFVLNYKPWENGGHPRYVR